MTLRWQTTGDNPCPACKALNGKPAGMGWDSHRQPGDGGPPPLHPNCECLVIDDVDAFAAPLPDDATLDRALGRIVATLPANHPADVAEKIDNQIWANTINGPNYERPDKSPAAVASRRRSQDARTPPAPDLTGIVRAFAQADPTMRAWLQAVAVANEANPMRDVPIPDQPTWRKFLRALGMPIGKGP